MFTVQFFRYTVIFYEHGLCTVKTKKYDNAYFPCCCIERDFQDQYIEHPISCSKMVRFHYVSLLFSLCHSMLYVLKDPCLSTKLGCLLLTATLYLQTISTLYNLLHTQTQTKINMFSFHLINIGIQFIILREV